MSQEETRLSSAQISQQIKKGQAVLVDVRRDDEWRRGHALGAIHLPIERILEGELPALDQSKQIYVYCASGNRAGQAEQILRQHGYQAANIGGLSDWQAGGGPVE